MASATTTTAAVCLDGFVNATVFPGDDAGTVCALGRVRLRGPLTLCTVHPAVEHVAVVPQPEGHLLEDPRYLGRRGGTSHSLSS